MQTNTNTHLTPKLRAPMKSFLDVRSQSQTSTDNLLSLSSAFSSLEITKFSQNKPSLNFVPILEARLTYIFRVSFQTGFRDSFIVLVFIFFLLSPVSGMSLILT